MTANVSTLPQSVDEIGHLLRSREISAIELTRLTLESIGALEAELNAFTTVTDGLALEQARAVDEMLARGANPGPLAGVPIAVKDTFLTSAVPTTGGSSTLRRY